MVLEGDFEFDVSGINTQVSKELESIASPADELFYKGRLLPLHLPLRIQMVEKLDQMLSSEIKPYQQRAFELEVDAKAQSENRGNCEKLGFPTTHKSCNVTHKICRQTYSKGSAPALDCKELLESTHSQPTAVARKLKASKAYLKTLLSKASNTRGANNHHSQNNIERESCDHKDAAAVCRSIDNSYETYRKSFSGRFSFGKGPSLIFKPYSKPFSSSNTECSTIGDAFLKRSLSSVNLVMENDIQEAIAHCKKSLCAEPTNMVGTSK